MSPNRLNLFSAEALRCLLALAVFLIATKNAVGSEPPKDFADNARDVEFFEKQIRPLLVKHCHQCHSAEADELQSGLRLDSRTGLLRGGDSGPAIVPGKPEESELIHAVSYDPDGYQMPPKGKLSDRQIMDLKLWVASGAVWAGASVSLAEPETKENDIMSRAGHWSFQPIQRQKPPPVHQTDWPQTPVDNFILHRLEAAGFPPAPEAGKRTWLRRVHFNLIGLPPSLEAIEDFLADNSPLAHERVVERLLASPRYGERWARHWLDLVRFAETAGNEFDYEIPFAWTYRDYVIRALNCDLSYDEFVVEHIAGDLLKQPRRDPVTGMNESTLGTGFFWLGQAMQSPIDVLGEQYDTIENQIDVMCKTFLGLTVACARCHDHKFDPISMRDYYALAGYLRSSRRQFAFLDDPGPAGEMEAQIESLDAQYRFSALQYAQSKLQSLATSVADGLLDQSKANRLLQEYLLEVASTNDSDLLFPWVQLSARETNAAFVETRDELVRQFRPPSQVREATTFEEFDAGFRQRWFLTGNAFTGSPQDALDLFIDTAEDPMIHRILPRDIAHSGRIHGKLRGVLRSPTFTIEKKFIDYLMYRVNGRPKVSKIDPGDIKEGQVHLILDGLHLIRQPIYQGLSIQVEPNTEPQWYRQDVSKWIGHRAYIEITDHDNGLIAIDRIQFNDSDPPTTNGNPLVVEMLSDPATRSRESLAQGYQRLLTESLDLWSSGRLPDSPRSEARIAIINWFLEHGKKLFGPVVKKLPRNDDSRDDELIKRVRTYIYSRRQLAGLLSAPTRGLAMVDGTDEDARVLLRGNHDRPGKVVRRRFLEVLHAPTEIGSSLEISGSGRLQLSRRLVATTNPLFARVIVNRLWQDHFGRGLVLTPDDFGLMGQAPSHPKLLDFLASELIRSKWSLKHMHRILALSSTARMSSAISKGREERDPENRLWHRMPVRRLEGEAIRDAMLAISGRLDHRMFGRGVLPHLTPFMEGRGRPEKSGPLDGRGRRSIYINVRRNFLTPVFVVFDYPAPQSTIGRRSVSNVPAQALTMMNNPFFIEQSRLWAEHVLDRPDTTWRTAITELYQSAFGRPPIEGEFTAAMDFLVQQQREYKEQAKLRAWSDLCHVLVNSREFIFVR